MTTIDNPKFYQRAWGRNSNDIFLMMTDGIAHYNGTDIQYLFFFNNTDSYSFAACIFENEVFFLVEEPSANLVYRGRLQKI